jgi:glycosyltransferase involved in cell wall biosynthesis
MRVLLSAYACEPHKGSEQEVGWQRAVHMLDYADEVWVLTRANSRELIEAEPISLHPRLHFLYYDLPRWATRLKKHRGFLPPYVMLWQRGAYRVACAQHALTAFDAVFHVTFAGMIHGSRMGRLGIPFVIGPIAGGERAPLALRRRLPVRFRLRELLRDASIFLQRYNPLTYSSLVAATSIYASTPESLSLIPAGLRGKAEVLLSIGTAASERDAAPRKLPANPHFIFAGRLLYWKGIHLAIRALAHARRDLPLATLSLYGSGPDEAWLRQVARDAGLSEHVRFMGSASHQELLNSFGSHTALIFPTLHDSGGLAALESLARGLPVICLDLGGPGVVVDDTCGCAISTAHRDEAEIVDALAGAMVAIATRTHEEMETLSQGALRRAAEFSWDNLTARVMQHFRGMKW